MKFRLYAAVRVSNLERSVKFYTQVLGMKLAHKGTMPHGGKYLHLRSPI